MQRSHFSSFLTIAEGNPIITADILPEGGGVGGGGRKREIHRVGSFPAFSLHSAEVKDVALLVISVRARHRRDKTPDNE